MYPISITIKNILVPGKLFEDMGLCHLGPIDGHNMAEMIESSALSGISPRPPLWFMITKGKATDSRKMMPPNISWYRQFQQLTGDVIKTGQVSPTVMSRKTIVEMASSRPDLVAITAAMRDGTKFAEFSKIYPRDFDVGSRAACSYLRCRSGTQRTPSCGRSLLTFLQRWIK